MGGVAKEAASPNLNIIFLENIMANPRTVQTWNNLISHVKRKMGAPLNMIEYTDDDIYDTIYTVVLPAMSQYIGKPMWIRLGSEHKVDPAASHEHTEFMYKIPIPDNEILIDIQEVYFNRDNMGVLGIYQNMLAVLDPRDTVMTNEFLDMLSSMEVVQAFHYIPPDKVWFERDLLGNDIILECKAVHGDLSTVPSDIYHEILKPWALAETLENVAALRNKFTQVSAPFGQIELNVQDMKQQAQDIRMQIQEKLDNMPPDHLLYIF